MGGSPQCMVEHVVLLPAISSGDQRNGECDCRHPLELVHREHLLLTHIAIDGQPMLLPVNFRNSGVVPHELDPGRCDEAGVDKEGERRFGVEGVATCRVRVGRSVSSNCAQ
eukprot:7014263-Pyramimonas_sp.AAC.2